MSLSWEQLDWAVLQRLREGFLNGGAAAGPYWRDHDDLAHYDLTYGERIGWKWDAVLGELQRRGWRLPAGPVLDWGCGSGIAGRRVVAAWPGEATALGVSDHSELARSFAAARASSQFPALSIEQITPDAPPPAVATLVVSHVLNELDALGRGGLGSAIEQAQVVLWVEPGTSDVAKELVQWRERLRERFRLVLPCPHQLTCGLLRPGNERHWCHHFAAPPPGVFADSHWVRFAQRAGIDLRSLPYSVLVLERLERPLLAPLPTEAARILGRPELFKPYARLLNCDATGVTELTLPKRVDPAQFRRLDRADAPRLWRWERDDKTIRRGTPL